MGSRDDAGARSDLAMESLRVACAALGESNRLRLLRCLLLEPRTVGSLVAEACLPQPLVSHHLAVLTHAGLLDVRRDGRTREYSVRATPPPMIQALLLLARASAEVERDLEDAATPAAVPAGSLDEHPICPAVRESGIEDFLL